MSIIVLLAALLPVGILIFYINYVFLSQDVEIWKQEYK